MVSITIGQDTYTGSLAKSETTGEGEGQQQEGQDGGRRKMKKMKAPKAKGTRKLSPYMKFAQQARKEILQENPGLKSDIIAVGKKIGEKWRALSDAEKAKY